MSAKKPTFEEYMMLVNDFIKTEAERKEIERSYIRLFRPYNTNKVNIMGSFESAIAAEGGNCAHFVPDSKKSFGMIADEQFLDYCFLYSKNRAAYRSLGDFTKYVNTNYRNFVIDDDELGNAVKLIEENPDLFPVLNERLERGGLKQSIQKALYARCILAAYFKCSMTIEGAEKDLDNIYSILEDYRTNKGEEERSFIAKRGKGSVLIKGTPSEKCIEEIGKNYRFIRTEEDNLRAVNAADRDFESGRKLWDFWFQRAVFKKDDLSQDMEKLYHDERISILDFGESIEIMGLPKQETVKNFAIPFPYERMNDMKVYRTRAGALYSGVIPRLVGVVYKEPTLDNTTVEGIKLELGRTSYFTMSSMGNEDWRSHYFAESYIDLLTEIDRYEVMVQDRYYIAINEIDTQYKISEKGKKRNFKEKIEKDFSILNEYLHSSIAQHNINISGNLVTEDGICLYTVRGGNIEDSGDFYCSANGGSEIYDSNVRFYNNSVEEDIPTIRYSTDNVYFGQELTRESIAELGLIDDSHVWNFYGLTIMGQKQNLLDPKTRKKKEERMSFHFNVIGERRCMDEFEHIVEQKKKAAENFESTGLFGYKLNVYEKLGEQIADSVASLVIPSIIENKDTIVWLFVFLFSMINYGKFNGGGIEEVLSLLFVIASAIRFIYKFVRWVQKRKYEKKVNIIINDSNILNISWICRKMCRRLGIKNSIRMDNILRVLTLMRFEDYFHE